MKTYHTSTQPNQLACSITAKKAKNGPKKLKKWWQNICQQSKQIWENPQKWRIFIRIFFWIFSFSIHLLLWFFRGTTVHLYQLYSMESSLGKVDNRELHFSVFYEKKSFFTHIFHSRDFGRSDVIGVNVNYMYVQKKGRRLRFFSDFWKKTKRKFTLWIFGKKCFLAVEIFNLLPINKFCIFKNIDLGGKYFWRALCF